MWVYDNQQYNRCQSTESLQKYHSSYRRSNGSCTSGVTRHILVTRKVVKLPAASRSSSGSVQCGGIRRWCNKIINNATMSNAEDLEGCRVRAPKRHVAPVKSAEELVKRFKEARPWHVDGKKFNTDTFKRHEQQHRDKYNMEKVKPMGQTYADAQPAAGGERSVTLQTVPLFAIGDYSFFVDPDDPLKGGFSLSEESGKRIAIGRGFAEVKFSHLTSNQAIPNRKEGTKRLLIDFPAPSHLVAPNNTLPNLCKKNEETHAEALVRAFEVKFVDEVGQKVYSPCKRWDEDSRKEAAFTASMRSKFVGWCNAYYTVRVLYKNTDPKHVTCNLTALRTKAVKNKPPMAKGTSWYHVVKEIK